MTLFVSEYAGLAVSGAGPSRVVQDAPRCPALAITQISSGGSTAAMSTINFNSATRFVHISNVGPNLAGFFFIGSSTDSAPTSTQVDGIDHTMAMLRGVPANGKMWVWSS